MVGSGQHTGPLTGGDPSTALSDRPVPSFSSTPPHGSGNRYTTYAPKHKPRSVILNSPWLLAAAGGVLVFIPFLLMKTLMPNSSHTKTPSPSPEPIGIQTPITQPTGVESSLPNGTAAVPETLGPESITVPTGQTLVREGFLKENQTMVYRVTGTGPR